MLVHSHASYSQAMQPTSSIMFMILKQPTKTSIFIKKIKVPIGIQVV